MKETVNISCKTTRIYLGFDQVSRDQRDSYSTNYLWENYIHEIQQQQNADKYVKFITDCFKQI